MEDFRKYKESIAHFGESMHAYRVAHDGYAPRDVFEQIFPLIGQYESFGAVVIVGGTHFAFVERGADMGAHWEGRYQLPCMTVKPNDTDVTLYERLARTELRIAKDAWNDLLPRISILPGRTMHWEEERKSRCRTRRCLIEVDDTASFGGVWRLVSESDLKNYAAQYEVKHANTYELIDHMVAAYLWYLDPDRESNPNADIDLRKYISTMPDPYPQVI